MIRFIIAKDYNDMSERAAEIIWEQVVSKPNSVLGLATGSTPVGIYSRLVSLYTNGMLDFSRVTTINLDEFIGINRENKYSYHHYMQEHFLGKVNIDTSRAYIPDGSITDALTVCEKYDEIIESVGGIDLQLLGLGHNGHIGFNEPSDVFPKRTHQVELTESTIKANARFFAAKEEIPLRAYTMGIQTIMEAKKILMVISGRDKATIAKKVFFGDITPKVPASILQLHHDVTVVGDAEALEEIVDFI